MRILLLSTSMAHGGAEVQLKNLAIRLVARGHEVMLVVLLPVQAFYEELTRAGVETRSLGMQRGIATVSGLIALQRLIRSWKPDFIQTWLYSADLLGTVAASISRLPIAWSLRCSHLHPSETVAIRRRRLAALLSGIPQRIFVNSKIGSTVHAAVGYRADKLVVIPNGFDVNRFRPDASARAAIRAELGVRDSDRLIGIVARFDPHKDHRTFFQAAGILCSKLPSARFVVVGRDIVDNPQIHHWMRTYDVTSSCILMGQRDDTERVNNAFDVATLTSMAEGFPNVLGEAMACSVPCVATGVGDVPFLLGDTGSSVPPHDAASLAHEWNKVLSLPPDSRARLGARGRARIVEHFGIDSTTVRYETEWTAMLRELERPKLRPLSN